VYDFRVRPSWLGDAACVECRDDEKGVIMKTSRQKTARLPGDHNHLRMRTPRQPETPKQNRLPARIWIETALGLMSAALLALTLLVPDWIELLFGAAPDAGNGSTEWGLAISLAAVSVAMFGFAGHTWRKHIRLLGLA
jgi:hypothetical protein